MVKIQPVGSEFPRNILSNKQDSQSKSVTGNASKGFQHFFILHWEANMKTYSINWGRKLSIKICPKLLSLVCSVLYCFAFYQVMETIMGSIQRCTNENDQISHKKCSYDFQWFRFVKFQQTKTVVNLAMVLGSHPGFTEVYFQRTAPTENSWTIKLRCQGFGDKIGDFLVCMNQTSA